MGHQPVSDYRPPQYPTREEVPADSPLLARPPQRWRRKALVVALLMGLGLLAADMAPPEFWESAASYTEGLYDRVRSFLPGQPQTTMGVVSASLPANEADVARVLG